MTTEKLGRGELPAVRELVRGGKLLPEDLVWREGLAGWVPVADSPELNVSDAAVAEQAANPLLAPIAGEIGPFRRIADSFRAPAGHWVGAVIATPLAIYFLKAREKVLANHNLFQLAQMVISDQIDTLRTCTAGELPEPIRKVLDPWGYAPGTDVIILPKAAMSRVKWIWTDSRIRFFCGDDEFSVDKPLFNSSNKRFLIQNGWTVNTQLSPTIAPIHGDQIDLPPGAAPRRRSVLKRIWYLAVALISLVFYLWFHFGALIFH